MSQKTNFQNRNSQNTNIQNRQSKETNIQNRLSKEANNQSDSPRIQTFRTDCPRDKHAELERTVPEDKHPQLTVPEDKHPEQTVPEQKQKIRHRQTNSALRFQGIYFSSLWYCRTRLKSEWKHITKEPREEVQPVWVKWQRPVKNVKKITVLLQKMQLPSTVHTELLKIGLLIPNGWHQANTIIRCLNGFVEVSGEGEILTFPENNELEESHSVS